MVDKTLSNKQIGPVFRFDDVKEFIRLLKEEMNLLDYEGEMKTIIWIIDKLAGEKLA